MRSAVRGRARQLLIVDAGALVDMVSRRPRGQAVQREILGEDLVAPELIDSEVLSALARLQRARELTEREADDAVERFTTLDLARISHLMLTERAWRMRHRVRVSDAFYVACAELVRAPLLTTDSRLSRAPLPGVSVRFVQ